MANNSKTIYLLRHGETDYNLRKMVQGSGIDAPLNDRGRKQAQWFFQFASELKFDHIFTSPMQRNIQTIDPFIKDSAPYTQLDGLKEISWGNQEGKLLSPESASVYQTMLDDWQSGKLDACIEGGESPNQVAIRQKKAFEVILNSEHKTILVCTHGRAMRIMLCWMLNYPLNYMDGFEHRNCCFYKLHYEHRKFVVNLFNQTSHLNGTDNL